MRYKLSASGILVTILLLFITITNFIQFLWDQSSLNDLFIILWALLILIIVLFEDMGYFNKKIVLTILVVVLAIQYGLILYQPFSWSEIQDYGITALFTILWIGFVLWMFRRWDKVEKAVGPYDKVLEANPDDVTSLNNKGVKLTNLKRYNWAMQCFDMVLELSPKDSAALHNKGVVITKLGKTRKYTKMANEYFDRALKSDPGFNNAKRSSKIILEN